MLQKYHHFNLLYSAVLTTQKFNHSGIDGMTIYKNIHMSLCNRPICYHTFVNKYYRLHTVHPQKS